MSQQDDVQANAMETAMRLRHVAENTTDRDLKAGAGRMEAALTAVAFGGTDPLPQDKHAIAALQAARKL